MQGLVKFLFKCAVKKLPDDQRMKAIVLLHLQLFQSAFKIINPIDGPSSWKREKHWRETKRMSFLIKGGEIPMHRVASDK